METEALDLQIETDFITVITESQDLQTVQSALEERWFIAENSENKFIPQNYTEITDFDQALKVIKMLEAFDEDDDVQAVYVNADIDDDLREKVIEFIEKNTFRT